jgi:starch synthase
MMQATAADRPLRIVFLGSEAVPFVKSGGLADVVGALPKVLRRRGHEVIVVLPKYRAINFGRSRVRRALSPLGVWMGTREEWCAADVVALTGVRFYFIDSEQYFSRNGLYHDEELEDYRDNGRRFGFFTRAALQLCRDLGFKPDIVHAHDWQTALAPAYLKIWHWQDPVLADAASVLTIHNIAHQGKYPAIDYDYLGLNRQNFTPEIFEDFGDVNFLKGGIHFADMVTTVSPTYRDETLGTVGGNGLGPVLAGRAEDYWGIVNGVDYSHWDPGTDRLIPARYGPRRLASKAECKAALQARLHLEVAADIPLIGVVGRLAGQKGLDLLAGCIEQVLATMRVQFAILGAGEKGLEWFFGPLPERYPGRVGAYIGYHEELAHWIEAGCDFFLMPSRFEPCGLNQIYSLKYGTLPIVRATGGLNDTVRQYDRRRGGSGTGFKFEDPTPDAVRGTIGWAVATWFDRPKHITRMIRRAMAEDFSWDRSAELYEAAYARAIANKRARG